MWQSFTAIGDEYHAPVYSLIGFPLIPMMMIIIFAHLRTNSIAFIVHVLLLSLCYQVKLHDSAVTGLLPQCRVQLNKKILPAYD